MKEYIKFQPVEVEKPVTIEKEAEADNGDLSE